MSPVPSFRLRPLADGEQPEATVSGDPGFITASREAGLGVDGGKGGYYLDRRNLRASRGDTDVSVAYRLVGACAQGVIALLQARLSDALDLEAQIKQAHWNVKGRDFFQLTSCSTRSTRGRGLRRHDAERITALGGVADGASDHAKDLAALRYSLGDHRRRGHLKAVAAVLRSSAAVRADIDGG